MNDTIRTADERPDLAWIAETHIARWVGAGPSANPLADAKRVAQDIADAFATRPDAPTPTPADAPDLTSGSNGMAFLTMYPQTADHPQPCACRVHAPAPTPGLPGERFCIEDTPHEAHICRGVAAVAFGATPTPAKQRPPCGDCRAKDLPTCDCGYGDPPAPAGDDREALVDVVRRVLATLDGYRDPDRRVVRGARDDLRAALAARPSAPSFTTEQGVIRRVLALCDEGDRMHGTVSTVRVRAALGGIGVTQ